SAVRRRSPPEPRAAATTDPHSGQGASPAAPAPPAPCAPPPSPADSGPLVRETSPPPPPAATAARAAAALVNGLPQSLQYCAPASFCRPQYWHAPEGEVIKLGGPIYCSTLACATCDSCGPRFLSRQRWAARHAAHRPSRVSRLLPPRLFTSPLSIPIRPTRFRRRILHSCSAASARDAAMSR